MDLDQTLSIRTRFTVILIAVFSCLACQQTTVPAELHPDAKTGKSTQPHKKQGAKPGEPITKLVSTSSVCAAGFDEAASHIEKQLFPLRIPSCLKAIGTACPLLSDAIRRAASNAAVQKSEVMSQTLYEAVKRRLSPSCNAVKATDSAEKLGESCYGKRHDLSSRLIADMHAGIFAFYLVVEEELKTKKLYDKNSRRILLNLLLTSAMEGEKKKRKKRR